MAVQLKRVILADVPKGGIVRLGERWGVVCTTPREAWNAHKRSVDFWDGGREHVREYLAVEWMPDTGKAQA